MKDDEGKHFTDLVTAEVSTMQGIGPKATEVAAELHINTVEDLANYKYYKWARALATLAETELKGDRPEGSMMNVNKMVDKAYETMSLKEIVDAPVAALQGVSDAAGSANGSRGANGRRRAMLLTGILIIIKELLF